MLAEILAVIKVTVYYNKQLFVRLVVNGIWLLTTFRTKGLHSYSVKQLDSFGLNS